MPSVYKQKRQKKLRNSIELFIKQPGIFNNGSDLKKIIKKETLMQVFQFVNFNHWGIVLDRTKYTNKTSITRTVPKIKLGIASFQGHLNAVNIGINKETNCKDFIRKV